MPATFAARFPGTCTLSGRAFPAGAQISRNGRGYALVPVASEPSQPTVSAAPFTGPLGFHGYPQTHEERQIDGEAERVYKLFAACPRMDPLGYAEAERQEKLLSAEARKRFHALCEMRNPYDR